MINLIRIYFIFLPVLFGSFPVAAESDRRETATCAELQAADSLPDLDARLVNPFFKSIKGKWNVMRVSGEAGDELGIHLWANAHVRYVNQPAPDKILPLSGIKARIGVEKVYDWDSPYKSNLLMLDFVSEYPRKIEGFQRIGASWFLQLLDNPTTPNFYNFPARDVGEYYVRFRYVVKELTPKSVSILHIYEDEPRIHERSTGEVVGVRHVREVGPLIRFVVLPSGTLRITRGACRYWHETTSLSSQIVDEFREKDRGFEVELSRKK